MLVTLGVNLSKTKNKEGSEIRHLQGEIRRLNKRIRHLEMELRSSRKLEHMYEISQDEEVSGDSEDTYIKKGVPCDGLDGCGKGVFIELEIMGKIYGTCTTCARRKRLK